MEKEREIGYGVEENMHAILMQNTPCKCLWRHAGYHEYGNDRIHYPMVTTLSCIELQLLSSTYDNKKNGGDDSNEKMSVPIDAGG